MPDTGKTGRNKSGIIAKSLYERVVVPLKAISVRLDNELLLRAGQMAAAMGKSRSSLMAQAIRQYVEHQEWFVRETEKGLQAAVEGRLIDHAGIKARWKAKHGTQVD